MRKDWKIGTVSCRIGNGFGVSNAALTYYNDIIRGFSPREVATMVRASLDRNSKIGRRVTGGGNCKRNLKAALELIEPASIPNAVKADYDRLIR
jgi:hypothetical protein